MMSLREAILDTKKRGVALGHFNISNSEGFMAVFAAAKKLNVPVIIGVSEGEREFIGVPEVAATVKAIREKFNYPIYLNADHTYSFEKCVEVIDAGFDEVIIDGAKLPFAENVALTKKVVDYARASKNPTILVEGELGYIGTSSKILDSLPEGAAITPEQMTHPDEAKKFVEQSGIDLFAPAVGNIHGMLASGKDPRLNIERIKEIADALPNTPLVLHGGSGTADEDFLAAIKAGIAIIHINTEIRIAFRQGLEKALAADPKEVAPYRYLAGGENSMEELVEKRLKLFSGM